VKSKLESVVARLNQLCSEDDDGDDGDDAVQDEDERERRTNLFE
jgi:hypothetical protein